MVTGRHPEFQNGRPRFANSLLAEKSKEIMMCHAISGCDTVSSFLAKEGSLLGLHGVFAMLSLMASPPSARSQKRLIHRT